MSDIPERALCDGVVIEVTSATSSSLLSVDVKTSLGTSLIDFSKVLVFYKVTPT